MMMIIEKDDDVDDDAAWWWQYDDDLEEYDADDDKDIMRCHQTSTTSSNLNNLVYLIKDPWAAFGMGWADVVFCGWGQIWS